MPAEFFLEVTMEAYERARIFPSLMVMPGYKQNPLYPPEKPICLHIKKEKKKSHKQRDGTNVDTNQFVYYLKIQKGVRKLFKRFLHYLDS